jgi:tetratricopeptide (TPR) repeat protein
MPQGLDQLDYVFREIARINQYDPTQDYLDRTIAALEFRLQSDPRIDWAYAIAIAQLLKKRIKPAIAAFERITQIDPANPYGWAYLAVVETIGIHPHAAYDAIDRAIAIAPTIPEFHTLRGVLAILYGNLSQARQDLAPSP